MCVGAKHGDTGGPDNEQAGALWAESCHSWHQSWAETVPPHHPTSHHRYAYLCNLMGFDVTEWCCSAHLLQTHTLHHNIWKLQPALADFQLCYCEYMFCIVYNVRASWHSELG